MGKVIKVKKSSFQEAIQTGIKKALLEFTASNFTAMRRIEHMAVSTSMEFEKSITDTLDLANPDHMQPELQEKYFQIVTEMKQGIVNSVMNASKALASFPKDNQDSANKK